VGAWHAPLAPPPPESTPPLPAEPRNKSSFSAKQEEESASSPSAAPAPAPPCVTAHARRMRTRMRAIRRAIRQLGVHTSSNLASARSLALARCVLPWSRSAWMRTDLCASLYARARRMSNLTKETTCNGSLATVRAAASNARRSMIEQVCPQADHVICLGYRRCHVRVAKSSMTATEAVVF
jgi:hypothetical protein